MSGNTQLLNFDQASGFQAQRNADWSASFTLTKNGAAFDLTGYSMEMTIRPYAGAPTTVAIIHSSDSTWQGIKIPTPTNGQVALQIAQATISANTPASPNVGDTYSCVYDLIVTDPTGHTFSWFYGAFDIAQGVS